MKGSLVTFEGGEGAGKTTLIGKLTDYYTKLGVEVLATREPGGSKLSEKIRALLLDKSAVIAPEAELLLFLAARAQQISEKIKPALDAGKIVFCDRYNDSTIVYQGIARGLGLDYVKNLCSEVTRDAQPKITIYLDLPPEAGLKRATGKPDRIEKAGLDFHRQVRDGYLLLAKKEPKRIFTIDSSQAPDAVFEQALKIVDAHV